MRMGLVLAVSNGSEGLWRYGVGVAVLVLLVVAVLVRRMRGKPGRHSNPTAEGAWRPPAAGASRKAGRGTPPPASWPAGSGAPGAGGPPWSSGPQPVGPAPGSAAPASPGAGSPVPGSPWSTPGGNGSGPGAYPAGPAAVPAQPGTAGPPQPVPGQPYPAPGSPAGSSGSKWGQPFDPPPPPRPAPPPAPGSAGGPPPSAPPPVLGGASSAGQGGLPGQPVDPVPGFEPLPAWNLDPGEEITRSRAPEPPAAPMPPPVPQAAPPPPPPPPPPVPPAAPPAPAAPPHATPAPYEPAPAPGAYEPPPAPAYEPRPPAPAYEPAAAPSAYEPAPSAYEPAPPASEPAPASDPSTGFDAPTPLATPIYEPAAPPAAGSWRAYEPGDGAAGTGTAQGVTGGDQTPTWGSSGTRVWETTESQATTNWFDEEVEFRPAVVPSYEGGTQDESVSAKASATKQEKEPGLGAPPVLEAPPTEKLAFVAAYPPAVVAGEWSPMLVVLHAASAQIAVEALLDRRAAEFGGEPARSSTTSAASVRRGTTLTLVPSVAGVEFNPPRLDVAWYEDVQEANFRMRATDSAGSGLYGAVEVFVGPLLVAVIPIGMRLTEASVAQALPTQTQRAAVLDRIFVSYSRRDTPVVQACATVYRALGVQVLMDTVDLRSGQDWRESLHQMISDADLFQLYWSSASAASSEVEHEWRYARTLTNKGPSFIRPLYWESPMPEPPVELSTVHFSRMDMPQIAG